jgi:hypothetical protein
VLSIIVVILFPINLWFYLILFPTIFSFIYILFIYFLWKRKFIRQLFNIKIPDLNGKYYGKLSLASDYYRTEEDIQVRIKQNWLKTIVHCDAKTFYYISLRAEVFYDSDGRNTLFYHYKGISKYSSSLKQLGSINLGFYNKNYLEGKIYIGDDNSEYGRIELSLKPFTNIT